MLSATIVLFKNDIITLKKTIESFLRIETDKKLFLVDNSPLDSLRYEFNHPEIEYVFIGKNIGFGAANNYVLKKIEGISSYHLILNPDVSFKPKVISSLIHNLNENTELAMIVPRVIYPDGSHQFSCRRFPSFFDLIVRRFGKLKFMFSRRIDKGEYKDLNLEIPFYVEYASGCFQLFKTADFIELKGFDERYFMYVEDIDICRKIIEIDKKILYYPYEFIIHNHEKGSSKKIKLFFYHVSSIFKYFYKWGMTTKKAT